RLLGHLGDDVVSAWLGLAGAGLDPLDREHPGALVLVGPGPLPTPALDPAVLAGGAWAGTPNRPSPPPLRRGWVRPAAPPAAAPPAAAPPPPPAAHAPSPRSPPRRAAHPPAAQRPGLRQPDGGRRGRRLRPARPAAAAARRAALGPAARAAPRPPGSVRPPRS